jgi:hypothetical protein
MAALAVSMNSRFGSGGGRSKDHRRASRKKVGSKAWIRDGFAVRPCTLVDLSDTGVQISVGKTEIVPKTFTFLMSRNSPTGRRAQIKWRRGTQIGAEFQSEPDAR